MARPKATLPKSAQPQAAPAGKAWFRMPTRGWAALAAGVVALVLAVAVLLARPGATEAAPGERVAIQGQEHIQPGDAHPPYNSDPPTSGWHYTDNLDAGFYETPYPDELLIHNLEHGHIVISYDCSKLANCEEAKSQIKQLMGRFNNWKVTAIPRENEDAAIALTAWGWIDKLEGFDQARMTAFINAWRDKGPERTME
jgi:hypothetical protein